MLTASRSKRIAILGVVAALIVGLFGLVVRQSLGANADATRLVDQEQDGAALLHPMTSVLGALVAAQSTAVRGEVVDAASVRTAFAAVTDEDAEHGVELGTHERLADLTTQVNAALARPLTGRDAYDTYSGLVTLAVALMKQIGDRSNLIHDPELDSYYLMDAAIIRLPEAVTLAGRAADLVVLADGQPLSGEDAVRAAVARFGVSDAAEQLDTGLTLAVASTDRDSLGTNIADTLDTFNDAARNFSPPTMLAELSSTVDAGILGANARRVSAAATPLAHRLLFELQALLTARTTKLTNQLELTLLASAFAGLLGIFMLYLLALGSSPARPVLHPSSTGDISARDARGSELPAEQLSYARQRLNSGGLVEVGRGGPGGPGRFGDSGDAR
jgi:hypothetical protein